MTLKDAIVWLQSLPRGKGKYPDGGAAGTAGNRGSKSRRVGDVEFDVSFMR